MDILNPEPTPTNTCQGGAAAKVCGHSKFDSVDWSGPGLAGYPMWATVLIGIALLAFLIFLMTRKISWPPDREKRPYE